MAHAVKFAVKQSPLAPALRAFLKPSLALAPALKLGRKAGWQSAAEWSLSQQGRAALCEQQLLTRLSSDINRDTELELLLTELRKSLLLGSWELLHDHGMQLFVCALIQQCINNEYVWFVSDEEQQRLDSLRDTAVSQLLTSQGWQNLCVLALYRPLHELLGLRGAATFTHYGALEALPEPFRVLVRGSIETYHEEVTIKASIERFGTIDDQVSQTVAAMYEVYPYPRWIQLLKPAPGSRQQWLKQQFLGSEETPFLNRPFSVLVPGCGTGRKAIQIALGFGAQTQVLATDLSRASLTYAARMARKYQLQNIRFLQMDILELPKFPQQFDIIECTGVLHHFRDPVEGGRAILEAARPGGLVHISLYSELARRAIIRLRRDYESHIMTIDTDYIRAYRRRLMLEQPDIIDMLPSDFFDLSRCKDLLFHPVEHRFTIPQVSHYIRTLGLQFLGLEQPKLLQNRYWTTFPPVSHRLNLDRWWEFEQKYPDAFRDLYEIWCRKPAQS
jgi:SAM-dependent methyltransferase